jgi:hypothetical protein
MLRCEWLYGDQLMRNFGPATIAPGKSSLVLAEAIAVATGRGLLGIKPRQRYRVWCWNGENPADEIDRGIAAICILYALRARTSGMAGFMSDIDYALLVIFTAVMLLIICTFLASKP